MPPVSKNQQTDLRVLPVVTATEPLEPRSLQLGLQSGTELENWICQKLVSSSGGTTTVQTMQLARQLSSDPVLLEKWVRALVEQGDPITIPERPIIRDPFNLSRRDPFAAVLERNGLGRSESESKLPSEIERLVSKARTEQLLEAGSRLPQTPEEAEAFFRSLPPEMQQQLLDTAAGEMTERTALRLQ